MKKTFMLSLCFAATLGFAQNINMSNGSSNTCSANFYDSGGPGANYGNNENFSYTFYPATAGSAIEIAFTSYQSGVADQISIYDGPDNTYPLLFSGGGTLAIPSFISTDITGSITVEFTSNGAGNQAGWVATISCCASPQFWYADNDGDGFGSAWDIVYACTAPAGYVANADDCDDTAILYEDLDWDGFGNPAVQAGCGVPDNTDCDDLQISFEDNDGDGFGNPNVMAACGVLDNTDCDDNNNTIGSGTMMTYYQDMDGDGFGTMWSTITACSQPAGYVLNTDDCDDWSITYEDLDGDGFGDPANPAPCGVYDNTDCDDTQLSYEDNDGDTFGNPNAPSPCGVINNTDCDDTNASIGSGSILTFYGDFDGDGFGDPWNYVLACTPPAGYVSNNDDCDDWSILYEDLDGDNFGNPAVQVGCGVYDNSDCDDNLLTYADFDGDNFGNPNMPDPCGIADNTDCDDNNSGVGGGTMTTYYTDFDGDGFGDPWNILYSCTPPAGYVANNDDCDDWGITYPDADGDGYGVPGAPVPCGAYNDIDCDDNLITYADNDGDTYGDPNSLTPCGVADNTDCDDFDPGVGGGAMTAYYNDWDGDSYGSAFWGVFYSCSPMMGMVTNSDDCDDFDPNVNPGETEVASNGIDDNCDGFIDPVAGINDPEEHTFTLYPNPADQEVYITFSENTVADVQIYNLNGQAVTPVYTNQGNQMLKVEVDHLETGIYFVQVRAGDETRIMKLIVN